MQHNINIFHTGQDTDPQHRLPYKMLQNSHNHNHKFSSSTQHPQCFAESHHKVQIEKLTYVCHTLHCNFEIARFSIFVNYDHTKLNWSSCAMWVGLFRLFRKCFDQVIVLKAVILVVYTISEMQDKFQCKHCSMLCAKPFKSLLKQSKDIDATKLHTFNRLRSNAESQCLFVLCNHKCLI